MATQAQANKARAANADQLARKGVHAVGVEAGKSYGKPGYVVVAYLEPSARVKLPATIRAEASKTEVPLIVERASLFKAE